ncbi:TonB-dependent receptor [Sphingopyxis sp. 550A]
MPINITAFGGDRLETMAARDVQDLTAYVPSFRVTQPGNAAVSALSLRGVGQRDINVHNEGAVALFLDGAYVSFIPAIAQPIFDVERIEVLKGPQGTLFGRNATGGLINMVTRRPTDSFDAYATAQYGSYNELKLEGAVGGPLGEGVSARASVNYTRSDGYIKNNTGPALNANDSLAGRLQILFKPSDNFSYLVSARGWRFFDSPGAGIAPTPFIQDSTGVIRSPANYAEYSAFCAPLTGGVAPPPGSELNGSCFTSQPNRFRGSYSPEVRFNQSYYGFTGTGEWALSDNMTLTSITDYQHLSNDYVSDIDATPAPIFNYEIHVKSSQQFSQELRLNGDTGGVRWVAGLYYLDIDHDITNVTDLYNHPAFGIRLPAAYQQNTKSYALFGQVDWEITPKLSLSLGARGIHDKKRMHNDSTCISNPLAPPGLCDILGSVVFPGALAFNRTFDGKLSKDSWSGRAVLQYKPNSDVMLYAGVTRGTKGGGFNSGAAEFYPLSAVEFKAETLVNYEAGIKAVTADRVFSFDGSVFYYDYNDYQSYSVSTDGGLRVLNVDATIKGAELSVGVRPAEGLSFNLAGTYLDTKQKNVPLPSGTFADFQVPDAPKWSLNGEMRYAFPISGDDELALQLNGVYVGKRSISAIDFPDQRIGAYHRFDARISYELPGRHWTIAAFANNFTDETIVSTRVDFTTVTGNTVDTIDRPRWFGASVTYRY